MRRSPSRRERRELRHAARRARRRAPRGGSCAARPRAGEVLGLGRAVRAAPGASGTCPLRAVDLLGPVHPFGVRKHDHRPARPLDSARLADRRESRRAPSSSVAAIAACICLGIVALDEVRLVAVAAQQLAQLVVRNAREHGRVRDLVAVQVQDRQDDAVALRVEELVRVPAGGERPGLRFAVADDAADEQVGVVERGAVGVHERVAELAALVDRARRLGRDVARDAAGERELPEEPAQPLLVAADVRVDLGVGALEVGVRDERRAAVARARDEDRVQVVRLDRAVQVRVEEVQAGRRPPVAEQARLDVLERAAARAAAGCRAGRSVRPRGSSPRASTRRAGAAPPPSAALPRRRHATDRRSRTTRTEQRASCAIRSLTLPSARITAEPSAADDEQVGVFRQYVEQVQHALVVLFELRTPPHARRRGRRTARASR